MSPGHTDQGWMSPGHTWSHLVGCRQVTPLEGGCRQVTPGHTWSDVTWSPVHTARVRCSSLALAILYVCHRFSFTYSLSLLVCTTLNRNKGLEVHGLVLANTDLGMEHTAFHFLRYSCSYDIIITMCPRDVDCLFVHHGGLARPPQPRLLNGC
jgi:hypothetical protein